MMYHRPGCLRVLFCAAFLSTVANLSGAPQAPSPQPAPAQQQPSTPQPPNQQPPAQPRPANPFETVPTAPAPAAPQVKPGTTAPQPGTPTVQLTPREDVVEAIQFRGARRVRQDTLQSLIFTKKGDRYDENALHRDFVALWNSGRFDDIRIERELGKDGWIITFVVVERPVVRSINYVGNKSMSQSDILDRFKERKVGLVVESQYDANKIQRAKNVLLDMEAERGHQYAKVDAQVHRVPPSSLEVTFKIDEGPKVKVGEITIVGNNNIGSKDVIRAMKNSHPIGLPHSILFENLFAKTYDSTKLDEDRQRVQVFYQEKGYFTARVTDAQVSMRKVGGEGFHVWLIYPNHVGTRADIKMFVEEGPKYHLNNITFAGVKFFKTPEALMTPLFGMSKGEVFSTAKLRKGIENMQKYRGYYAEGEGTREKLHPVERRCLGHRRKFHRCVLFHQQLPRLG
jgi:outer membrane protein insertion porin family